MQLLHACHYGLQGMAIMDTDRAMRQQQNDRRDFATFPTSSVSTLLVPGSSSTSIVPSHLRHKQNILKSPTTLRITSLSTHCWVLKPSTESPSLYRSPLQDDGEISSTLSWLLSTRFLFEADPFATWCKQTDGQTNSCECRGGDG